MTQQDRIPITKVVITLTGATGFIGIQAAECDPFFTSVEISTEEDAISPLNQALVRLGFALDEAQVRWQGQTRNPTYERPVPAVRPATPTTTTARTGRQTPATEQKPLF